MPATKMTAAKSRAMTLCNYLMTEMSAKLENNLTLQIINPPDPRKGTQLFFKLEKEDGYCTCDLVDVACGIAQVVSHLIKHKVVEPKNALVVQIDHLKSAADAKIIQAAITTAYTFDSIHKDVRSVKTCCFADKDETDFDLICVMPMTTEAAVACDTIASIGDIVKIMNGDY